MRVAIIQACWGRKRMPRKNIKEFNAKPIMAWIYLLAQKSGLFNCIVVSIRNTLILVV